MIRTISINDVHSMDMLQEQRDHSEPPEYWAEPEPPTWGDWLWEEEFLSDLAREFLIDGGCAQQFTENTERIARMIESGDTACQGDAWEYLAEYWLDAGGSADDFTRLANDLAKMVKEAS